MNEKRQDKATLGRKEIFLSCVCVLIPKSAIFLTKM